MSDYTVKECCDFIMDKFPNIKCDFTNLPEIRIVLKNLIEKRCNYLIDNNGGIRDEFILGNDLELVDLEAFYNMIGREIKRLHIL